jgi:prophage regulatory protein
MARTLLRMPAVVLRTGLTVTDVYARMKAGTFPASVPIGVRTVGWVDTEVDAWVEQRIANRNAQSQSPKRRKGGPGRGHRGPMKMIETERTNI